MSQAGGHASGSPRLRPASARGRSGASGIATLEAFSRGDAIDPAWMGWGALRVLSHQEWAPGAVRDEGRVANMERLLRVLEGTLDAGDGPGRRRIEAGGALWIGAGHGIAVRLANASTEAPLRLVEAWLQPDRVNAEPKLAARAPATGGDGAVAGWVPLAAGIGRDATQAAGARGAALPLRQRARVLEAALTAGEALQLPADAGRCWLEVLAGDVIARAPGGEDVRLAAGDGLGWLATDPAAPATVTATDGPVARLLLFALPA